MNTGYMYLFELVFSFFLDIYIYPGVGLLNYMITNFSFLRNLHTILHSDCTNLQSHQQCKRVSFLPHPSPTFIICRLLVIAILTGVRWYLIVVLMCIFLIISNTEHIFMCLLAICMSTLEKYLLRSSAHFWIWLSVFLILSYMSCLYILDINS